MYLKEINCTAHVRDLHTEIFISVTCYIGHVHLVYRLHNDKPSCSSALKNTSF